MHLNLGEIIIKKNNHLIIFSCSLTNQFNHLYHLLIIKWDCIKLQCQQNTTIPISLLCFRKGKFPSWVWSDLEISSKKNVAFRESQSSQPSTSCSLGMITAFARLLIELNSMSTTWNYFVSRLEFDFSWLLRHVWCFHETLTGRFFFTVALLLNEEYVFCEVMSTICSPPALPCVTPSQLSQSCFHMDESHIWTI